MNKLKGILIIVLAVLIAGLGYLYLSGKYELSWPLKKVSDETAGWKTYTNKEYGFEFSYPEEFGEVITEVGNTSHDYEDCKINGLMFAAYFSEKEFMRFGGVSRGYNECGGRGAGLIDTEAFDVTGNRIKLHTWYGKDFIEGDILDIIKLSYGGQIYVFEYDSGYGDIKSKAAIIQGIDDKLASLTFAFGNDINLFKKVLSTFKFIK